MGGKDRREFTRAAVEAVRYGQLLAHELRRDYIGTEHILLGLLHQRGSLAAKALRNLGMEYESALSELRRQTSGEQEYPSDNPYYTPRAKRVMEGAVEEADRLGASVVDTEHILISMLEDAGGAAVELIEHFGIELNDALNEVFSLLEEKGDYSEDPRSGSEGQRLIRIESLPSELLSG